MGIVFCSCGGMVKSNSNRGFFSKGGTIIYCDTCGIGYKADYILSLHSKQDIVLIKPKARKPKKQKLDPIEKIESELYSTGIK